MPFYLGRVLTSQPPCHANSHLFKTISSPGLLALARYLKTSPGHYLLKQRQRALDPSRFSRCFLGLCELPYLSIPRTSPRTVAPRLGTIRQVSFLPPTKLVYPSWSTTHRATPLTPLIPLFYTFLPFTHCPSGNQCLPRHEPSDSNGDEPRVEPRERWRHTKDQARCLSRSCQPREGQQRLPSKWRSQRSRRDRAIEEDISQKVSPC